VIGAKRSPIYVFEGFQLDAQHRVLSRVGGEPIPVTSRVFDILLFFVEHPAELLSNRTLLEAIWPNTVVEENNLNQAVSRLRQVLGEEAGEHRFIVNQPGRGYRFVATVTTVRPDSMERADQPRDVQTVRRPGHQPMTDVEAVPARIPPGDTTARASSKRRRLGLAVFAVTAFAIVLLLIDDYAATPADGTAVAGPATPDRDPRVPRIVALTFDGGVKNAPRLSPDGEMVVFTWDGPKGDNTDVYVKPIGRDTEPIRITDHPAAEHDAIWSPDGKRLAFLRTERDRTSIWSTPALGGRDTKVIDVESPPFHGGQFVGAMTWSPDGRSLVYGEKTSAEAAPRLVQVELATGEKRELTPRLAGTNVWGDFGPSFSSDGRIAFVRGASISANLDIWTMDADGQRARQIVKGQWRNVLGLGWTSDGRQLLFTAGGPGAQRAYSIRAEEGAPYPLPGLGQDDRGASAAGNRLVFVRSATRQLEIWRAPGRSVGDWEAASQRVFQGSKLVVSPRGDRSAFQAGLTGRAQVWIANTDGTDARALTEHETPAFDPQWSPDGSHIAYWSAEAGSADIYLIELESGRVRRVTTDGANNRRPTFSRNGRWIYFSSDRSGMDEIYKMPTEGGEAVRITRDGGVLAYESHDERYVYYQKDTGVRRVPYYETDASILRIPTDGRGEAAEILAAHFPSDRGWVLAEGGIYYLLHEEQGPAFTIRYRDVGRLTDDVVFGGTGEAFYPTVSPDEKTIFFSRWPAPQSELWLVEDFR
jgi:Tol biopolymer transport system component/DNA-binding winged helix-turn-helix (wHTH) protein